MRNLVLFLALFLPLAAVADTTVVAHSVDTTTLVLPSGDTIPLIIPELGTPPTGVEDLEGLLGFINWVYIALFLLVGYLKPFIPVLNRIRSKELALLAFFVASITALVAFRWLFGEEVTVGDAIKLFVNAAVATRIYAWGFKAAATLWQTVKSEA